MWEGIRIPHLVVLTYKKALIPSSSSYNMAQPARHIGTKLSKSHQALACHVTWATRLPLQLVRVQLLHGPGWARRGESEHHSQPDAGAEPAAPRFPFQEPELPPQGGSVTGLRPSAATPFG